MKRSGFTMIELIFVIVILGILAAVAIPRLAATRSDAQIARISADAASVVSDFGANFTARGDFNGSTTWSQVTNVATETAAGVATTANDQITTAVLLTDGTNTCATFTASQSVANGMYDRLTVTVPANPNGAICTEVKNRIVNITKAHTFGGTNVVQ